MKRVNLYIISSLLLLTGGLAMGMGELGKVCLFSGISGVIMLDGKPVANARLVRTADRDGAKTDETMTDKDGRFSFPAMFERTVAKYLPQEFVSAQQIHVHFEGKNYEMWTGVKRKQEENTESRGKPLVVKCELNSARNTIYVDHAVYITMCTWDVEPDPIKVWKDEDLFDNSMEQKER
jgi:hypothetical protein